eukprot:COSAG01_NODE_7011_length_3393_cov_4.068913_2_plen_239_part_00
MPAAFSLKKTHTYSTFKQLVHTPNYVSARRLPSSRLSLRLPPTPEGGDKTGCLRPRHRLACCVALVGQTRGHCHAAGLVVRCFASHAASLSGTPPPDATSPGCCTYRLLLSACAGPPLLLPACLGPTGWGAWGPLLAAGCLLAGGPAAWLAPTLSPAARPDQRFRGRSDVPYNSLLLLQQCRSAGNLPGGGSGSGGGGGADWIVDGVVADAEGTPPAPRPFHAFQPAFCCLFVPFVGA